MEREEQLKLPSSVGQPMLLLEGGDENRSYEHTLDLPKTLVSSLPNPLQGFTTGKDKERLQVYLWLVGFTRAAVAPHQDRSTAAFLPVHLQTSLISY